MCVNFMCELSWEYMLDFSPNAVLYVLSDDYYDADPAYGNFIFAIEPRGVIYKSTYILIG